MNQFSERLKSARVMGGLSLQELADKLNNRVTRQALHKYEKGEFMPDSEMIGLLCDALDVRPDYFFRKEELNLEKVNFRKYTRFPIKAKNSLEQKTRDKLARYLELEQILNIETRFSIDFPNDPIRSNDQVDEFTVQLRAQLNLGQGPIFNLLELLEDNHVKVLEIESEESFDGLSAWANNKQVPIVVLNSNKDRALDRKRFTALHELGHLLMNLDGVEDKQKEKYCHYFAAAMLLPKETLFREVGRSRHKVFIPELGAIKKQYGISIQAIAYRMKDLGIITESYFRQFMFFVSQMGFKTEEPAEFDYKGEEQSNRFNQLLMRALAEELISMSKAAALSNMKLAEFRDKNLRLG